MEVDVQTIGAVIIALFTTGVAIVQNQKLKTAAEVMTPYIEGMMDWETAIADGTITDTEYIGIGKHGAQHYAALKAACGVMKRRFFLV